MSVLRFDRSRIQALVERAGARLDGGWLLVGGSAAAIWFAPERTTEDVDLVGLEGTQDERLALMDLAAEASIPVEAVNSAAAYFIRKIPDWRDHLVEVTRGQRATIYRPTATLFLLLKIGRLSETDLEDCLALLAYCEEHADNLDRERLRMAVSGLPATDDAGLRDRRATLLTAL
jgi:hypothetical protein